MNWPQFAVTLLFSALPYVLAMLVGLGLSVLAMLTYYRFAVGMTVIGLTFTLETLYISSGGFQLGISLYYTDLSLGFIAGLAALRWVQKGQVFQHHWGWLLYVAIFTVNLVWGLGSFGTAAGVQARPYFYAMAITSYAISFALNERHLRQLLAMMALISVCFLLLCVFRWTVYYLPITELLPEEGNYNAGGALRVIRSNETLLLAQSLIAYLFFNNLGITAHWMRPLAPILMGAVIALQHRSVWVASITGVMFSLLIAGGSKGPRMHQFLLLIGTTLVTMAPLMMSDQLGGVVTEVARSAQSGAAGEGTAGERLDSWQQIVSSWSNDGPVVLLIGRRFGADSSRLVHDQTTGGVRRIDYTAHNHYVQTLASMGLLGLLGFMAAFTHAVTGLYRLSQKGIGSGLSEALLVLLLMQAVYYIPYSTDYFQHLILGVALAYVASHREALGRLPSKSSVRPARPSPWCRFV